MPQSRVVVDVLIFLQGAEELGDSLLDLLQCYPKIPLICFDDVGQVISTVTQTRFQQTVFEVHPGRSERVILAQYEHEQDFVMVSVERVSFSLAG